MYQIFFNHSSVDEQLGCFHVLAIVNSGAVNIEVHISFQITVFSRFMGASFVVQLVKNLPAVQETWVPSLGWEDPLEKGMATHSSILAWRIPWTV